MLRRHIVQVAQQVHLAALELVDQAGKGIEWDVL